CAWNTCSCASRPVRAKPPTAVRPPSTKVRRRKEPCRSFGSEKKMAGSELILLRSLRELRRIASANVHRPALRSLGGAGSSEPHVAVLEPLDHAVGEREQQKRRRGLSEKGSQARRIPGEEGDDQPREREGQPATGHEPDEKDRRLLSDQEAARAEDDGVDRQQRQRPEAERTEPEQVEKEAEGGQHHGSRHRRPDQRP